MCVLSTYIVVLDLGVPGLNPDYKSLDEDEDEQETEKSVLKLPPSLGDILSKKQNGSIDDAQDIRNNKLPVLDDQIKDYEEDFPNDKEKRGNIKVSFLGVDSLWGNFTFVLTDWGSL